MSAIEFIFVLAVGIFLMIAAAKMVDTVIALEKRVAALEKAKP